MESVLCPEIDIATCAETPARIRSRTADRRRSWNSRPAYPIERAPDDPFQSKQVNYHYLLVEVDHQQLKVTMNRLELNDGKAA